MTKIKKTPKTFFTSMITTALTLEEKDDGTDRPTDVQTPDRCFTLSVIYMYARYKTVAVVQAK